MTDPLAGIDAIDWKSLHHAYGSATDVPDCLRKLQSPDESVRAEAYWSLYSNIYHQGTRYPATPVAVPFLYKLLDDPVTPGKERLMILLLSLAIGLISTGRPTGMDVAAWKGRMDLEDSSGRKYSLSGYQSYQAVQDGIDSIRALLVDNSPMMRARAAYFLAWFPDAQQETQPALFTLLDNEQDVGVQATTLFSLAVIQAMTGDFLEGKVVERLRAVHDEHANPFVRWVSSLGLVKLRAHTPKQLSEVVRKFSDPTYLEEYEPSRLKGTSFAWAGFQVSGLDALIAMETSYLKGSEHPELASAMVSAMASTFESAAYDMKLATLTETALQVVFDGEKPARGGRFEDLKPAQQEFVAALARVEGENWMFGNFTLQLRDWNLPRTRDGMREFSKTGKDVPRKL